MTQSPTVTSFASFVPFMLSILAGWGPTHKCQSSETGAPPDRLLVMPSEGHRHRKVRVPDDHWDAFLDACPPAERGRESGAAKVVRDFIAWYIHYPNAKAPKRPSVAAWKGRQPKGDHEGSSGTSR